MIQLNHLLKELLKVVSGTDEMKERFDPTEKSFILIKQRILNQLVTSRQPEDNQAFIQEPLRILGSLLGRGASFCLLLFLWFEQKE